MIHPHHSRRAAVLVVVCLFGVSAHAGERYALVIGVNECPDFRLAGDIKPRPLRGAESDAQAMSKCCHDTLGIPKDHIHLLLGKQATLREVRRRWKQLDGVCGKDDSILFYFAGHGTQVKDQRPLDEEDDGLDEALCLADAKAGGENLLLDDELGNWLEESKAGRLSVILDACHSGTGTKDTDDDLASRHLPSAASGRKTDKANEPWRDLRSSTKSLDKELIALFACQPNQQAYERRMQGQKSPQRSGQFTHFVLEGLTDRIADRNQDGMLSAKELLDHVQARLDASFNEGRTQSVDRQQPALLASRNESVLLQSETNSQQR